MSLIQLRNNIKYLRVRKNLSQEQISSLIGVSRSGECNWETGYSIPKTEHLVKLSELFGISIDDLVRKNFNKNIKNYK